MIDTDDPIKVKKRQTKAELVRMREVDELRAILQMRGGRNAVWRVLEKCGVHGISFRGEMTHETAFNEGARNVGNWLMQEVFTADSGAYSLMRQEAQERDRVDADT